MITLEVLDIPVSHISRQIIEQQPKICVNYICGVFSLFYDGVQGKDTVFVNGVRWVWRDQ